MAVRNKNIKLAIKVIVKEKTAERECE